MFKANSKKLIIAILVLLFCCQIVYTEEWYEKGSPHFINEQDYERLVIKPETRNKGVTILKFFTPWCRYCKYLKDIIDELKARQTWAITVYEVNCDSINYNFCGQMGVRSFPKMAVFQNGIFQQSMDGFYPYQVVRELFIKYNRTTTIEQPPVAPTQPATQQTKQKQTQQVNYVEPQIVQPEVKQQKKQQQQKTSQHAQPQHKQQQVHVEPVKVKQEQPDGLNANQVLKANKQTISPQSKQTVTQNKQKTNNLKKTQEMIEEEENIAVVDQNLQEIETEKKIAEQVQKSVLQTIDLTKIIPEEHITHYGKYIMYAICILVGGYYFVHIMKADSAPDSQRPSQSTEQRKSAHSSQKNVRVSQQVSIQDSQLREELNFEHPNEEQVNFNTVQIRDEDL